MRSHVLVPPSIRHSRTGQALGVTIPSSMLCQQLITHWSRLLDEAPARSLVLSTVGTGAAFCTFCKLQAAIIHPTFFFSFPSCSRRWRGRGQPGQACSALPYHATSHCLSCFWGRGIAGCGLSCSVLACASIPASNACRRLPWAFCDCCRRCHSRSRSPLQLLVACAAC